MPAPALTAFCVPAPAALSAHPRIPGTEIPLLCIRPFVEAPELLPAPVHPCSPAPRTHPAPAHPCHGAYLLQCIPVSGGSHGQATGHL